MKICSCTPYLALACAVAVGAGAASFASYQNAQDKKPAGAPAGAPAGQDGMPPMPLPPGWTPKDMEKCMNAGTPGPMQAWLCTQAGVWKGKSTMWPGPGMEPMQMECVDTAKVILDGRYIDFVWSGDMPGMGPFEGRGVVGFDNVTSQFVGTWIDTMSTGMMVGTGKLSDDKKTMNWTYTYNCPITGKQATLRQVETFNGPDSKKFEMFMTDPISKKEYKAMSVDLVRAPKA